MLVLRLSGLCSRSIAVGAYDGRAGSSSFFTKREKKPMFFFSQEERCPRFDSFGGQALLTYVVVSMARVLCFPTSAVFGCQPFSCDAHVFVFPLALLSIREKGWCLAFYALMGTLSANPRLIDLPLVCKRWYWKSWEISSRVDASNLGLRNYRFCAAVARCNDLMGIFIENQR